MTTNILLALISVILLFGFIGILSVLCEIRDACGETNGHVEALKDEIVDEEDKVYPDKGGEALKAASDYWSKAGYGSGKGKPP